MSSPNLIRLLGGGSALLAVAVVASGCGSDKPPVAKPPAPCIRADVALEPDEAKQSFSKTAIKTHDGLVRLTVTVPKDAKGSHGVAVDGGVYKNVEGASVKPGKATSLTIDLKPGRYTVYDPQGSNRKHGYTTELTVTKAPKGACK